MLEDSLQHGGHSKAAGFNARNNFVKWMLAEQSFNNRDDSRTPEIPAVKVTLIEWPKSVEELISILREKVKRRLDFEFTLQYEDPDFDGELCCLVDVQDLPEKGTLKVVRSESDTNSSSNTDILPHVPVSQRQKTWPDIFL